MPTIRKREYKPLLFTTTVRNPQRVKYLLNIFLNFDGQMLTNDLAETIVGELIKYGLYRPKKVNSKINKKWASTAKGTFAEKVLTKQEVKYVIENNPQQHKEAGFDKGYPSRFATIFDFAKELGFVFYNPNEPICFSDLGRMLAQVYKVETPDDGTIKVEEVHPEYEQQVFLLTMAKYQRKNPFVRVLNDNVPMILLLQVIQKLNANKEYLTEEGQTKGISVKELPLIIFWKNNDAEAIYQRIRKIREDYGYNPSDEVIIDICLEEIMGNFKEFKSKSIMKDYPDEFIRKMRITGLFSLRGVGRFLDINYNEIDKVNYIIQHYSIYTLFTEEKAYFNYMAEVDSSLLTIKTKKTALSQNSKLLDNWVKALSWNTIKKELHNLSVKRASSHQVLKFLSQPIRLEFLTAVGIKSKLPSVTVHPNYVCDDTGLPTSTAPGDKGDIECIEAGKGILIEVTMAEGRTQTIMEIWPIERHLNIFAKNYNNSQAFFIAPSIYSDSQRQIDFVRYNNGNGNGPVILPFTIDSFISYLEESQKLYKDNK